MKFEHIIFIFQCSKRDFFQGFKIQSPEFHDLNLALDCAIAEAVTEFEKVQNENAGRSEVKRLSFFIHEMGNSLAAASIAHNMIQKGRVGSSGITSNLLGGALLIGCGI